MRGTVYYYYDNILVTNCKLKTLDPYAGRMNWDFVVQLLIYPRDDENVPNAVPEYIFCEGEYYLLSPSEDVIYQIHCSGKLIRAYAPTPARVEETIKGWPMAILSLIQAKILLNGAALLEGNSAYAFVGEIDAWKANGLLRDDTILIRNDRRCYRAVLPSYPGYEAAEEMKRPTPPELKGIFVVRQGGEESGIAPIEPYKEKKSLIVENCLAFSKHSWGLQHAIEENLGLEDIAADVPMAFLNLQESGEGEAMNREALLSLVKGYCG